MVGLTALHPRPPSSSRAVGLAQMRDLLLEAAGPGRGERVGARVWLSVSQPWGTSASPGELGQSTGV